MKKQFCVCLSHDVDRVRKTFQFGTHFFRSLSKGELGAAVYQIRSLFQRAHYWNFYRIMEIERKLDVRSTFYFLNESYPFHIFEPSNWRLSLGYYDLFEPDLQTVIRELDSQGWEIGLHGSYLSYKNLDLLKKEKSDLEEITGHLIAGVRQHYLNLDEQTWERQAEAGFLYDASFGFSNNIGFKENKFHPFRPMANRDFYVVPLALMDACVMGRKNPLQEAVDIIEVAEEKGACLVLCWHQRVFNEQEFPGYKDMYLRLVEQCRNRGARFLTIGEYIREVAEDHVASSLIPACGSHHVTTRSQL